LALAVFFLPPGARMTLSGMTIWRLTPCEHLRTEVEDHGANTFYTEVDRALDNLAKSGKMFNNLSGRRDSMPLVGAPRGAFPEQFGKILLPNTKCFKLMNFRSSHGRWSSPTPLGQRLWRCALLLRVEPAKLLRQSETPTISRRK
jgi:hypothetical protein